MPKTSSESPTRITNKIQKLIAQPKNCWFCGINQVEDVQKVCKASESHVSGRVVSGNSSGNCLFIRMLFWPDFNLPSSSSMQWENFNFEIRKITKNRNCVEHLKVSRNFCGSQELSRGSSICVHRDEAARYRYKRDRRLSCQSQTYAWPLMAFLRFIEDIAETSSITI